MDKRSQDSGSVKNGYTEMINLFEQVRERLNEDDLKYVIEKINEYDYCRSPEEAQKIQEELIGFCSKRLA